MTSPNFPHGETLTLLRAAAPDRFGDPTGAPAETIVDGCVVWPAGSTEQTGDRDTVTGTLVALMPPASDVRPTDQARYRGDLYNVTGDPETFSSPFTDLTPGVQVTLTKVTG